MRATLIHAREGVYVLYSQIGKVVHELHGEVLAVLDELPFAYRVGEVRYLFHAEVGEAAHYLHSEVGEVLDDLDAAAELYVPLQYPSGVTFPAKAQAAESAAAQRTAAETANIFLIFRKPPISRAAPKLCGAARRNARKRPRMRGRFFRPTSCSRSVRPPS